MICKINNKKGVTLIELLIVLGIFSGVVVLLGAFQADIFNLNSIIQTGLQNQNEARKILRPFTNEVRSASPSELGAYALSETASSTFIFYSDIDNDGERERVRYYLEGSEFKKGVIEPSGTPTVYKEEDEKIIKVVRDVINTDIFTYYNSNYDGQATSNPLIQPVSPSSVRLIKVELIIDSNPNKPPEPITIGTQVSVRNLKDNL